MYPSTPTSPTNRFAHQSHKSNCEECRRPPLEDHMYWPNVWHIKSGSREMMHEVRLTRPRPAEVSPGEVDRCTCEHGQSRKRGEPAECHHVKWARFRRGQALQAVEGTYGYGELFEGEEVAR